MPPQGINVRFITNFMIKCYSVKHNCNPYWIHNGIICPTMSIGNHPQRRLGNTDAFCYIRQPWPWPWLTLLDGEDWYCVLSEECVHGLLAERCQRDEGQLRHVHLGAQHLVPRGTVTWGSCGVRGVTEGQGLERATRHAICLLLTQFCKDLSSPLNEYWYNITLN